MSEDGRYIFIESAKSRKPDVSVELKELLDRLDLSPSVLLDEEALAIDDNSSSSSGPGSIRNADSGSGYPEKLSRKNSIDRRVLLEEFVVARSEGEIYESRNVFFHDQLVEHFKRKQMMRVYGAPNEEDKSKNRYIKKLLKYENLRQELQAGEEELKTETILLRDELRKKTEEADAAVDELVGKERAVGAQSYSNGKPLAGKEIQALITRELVKMKEISKIRVRYARLRDTLVEKELVFDAINILTPNLDKKDYERLEAENFYYKHELRMIEREVENLALKRDRQSNSLKTVKRELNKLSQIIQKRGDRNVKLKRKLVKISKLRLTKRRKIEEVENYFEKLESILGLRLYPEVNAKVKDISCQRDKWLAMIAGIVSEIKKRDECLKSLGKGTTFLQIAEQTNKDEESDDGISYPEKTRRPPLGGGFLQAL